MKYEDAGLVALEDTSAAAMCWQSSSLVETRSRAALWLQNTATFRVLNGKSMVKEVGGNTLAIVLNTARCVLKSSYTRTLIIQRHVSHQVRSF